MAKRTKQAILNTFESLLEEKNFDKITVVEIVERCGVNRNTFYYYFQDIYALLEVWLEQSTTKKDGFFPDNMELLDVFLRAVKFAQESKTMVYHIYRSMSHVTLRKYLEEETYKLTVTYIGQRAAKFSIDPKDVQALAVFYTSAINGILYRWLDDEMRYDPEPFIKRICRILDGNIDQLLQKLSDDTNN